MLESGRLPMDQISSRQLPLERFQEGLDLVADGSSTIKVSLLPS
jgi:threonine dehydrogenase-like Zn-dependent dehydrogenase